MTNMYLTQRNSNLEDAVKAYKKDWHEIRDEKEAYKNQYWHQEDLIKSLDSENRELKEKIKKLEKKIQKYEKLVGKDKKKS